MNNQIDYTQLSKDELFDVLEQIDDEQHPSNAKAAYLALQEKFSINQQDLDDRYDDDGVVSSVAKLLLVPFGEQCLSKRDMQAKLRRIGDRSTAIA